MRSGVGHKEVVTVSQSTTAGDAFHLMAKRRITSVGVVDSAGRLVGNLSASDLRVRRARASSACRRLRQHVVPWQGLTADSLVRFALPVLDFKPDHGKLVTVHRSATLAHVLKELVTHQLHRVYEVDGAGKPLLIITLTDIMRLVAKI